MKSLFLAVFAMLISMTAYASNDDENIEMNDKKITDSTVMLYYKNLDAPRSFYKDLLGLESTYEDVWVSIYKLTPSSAVGLVLEGGTAYHKAKQDNAVMLSIGVEDVDAWYEKIQSAEGVKTLKEIYDHPKAPIRAFLVEDPGGYTIEILQWLK
ncbi:MAG: putative enzyme related to lactoylglutathione lyase [Planctomycetota bacterium]|jgi:predicted enzyme related to lactoylglutathione lyase